MLDTREKLLDFREKLAELDNEDAPKYDVDVAQNLLVDGAYLIPPVSMSNLAGDVVEAIGD